MAVNAAIRSEIDRLTAPARSLLTGAALLGEPFEPGLAAETAGIEEAAVPDALDELLDADLIRSADTLQRFGFRHPIVRHAVYESAGAGWRLNAHARAAAMLEARKASASERAPHLERSARVGEQAAADVLAQAGLEAMLIAPASAAHWFDAALRLTPEREDNLEFRLGLLSRRAATLGSAGRIEQSREALDELLVLASTPSKLRHEATILAAILDEMLGNHQAGRELLQRELSGLVDQQSPEAADLMREVSFTCFIDADWEATAHWAMQSLATECEGMTKVGALASLGLAEFGLGKLEQVQRSVSEAADLFDSLNDAEIGRRPSGNGDLARLGGGVHRALR